MSAASPALRAAELERRGTALESVLASADVLRESLAPLGASNIAVFGSVARKEDHADSDIDLLVDLDPDVGLFALLRMRRIAEDVLGRRVDLVPRSDLKPDLTEAVRREAIAL